MTLSKSVDNFHQAVGRFLVTLGVVLMQWGLEKQGKKLDIMLRADIKKIFLEGFEMGRDTKDLNTEEEVEWYDAHSLYEPEEAWLNSDAEEIIPTVTPDNNMLNIPFKWRENEQ